MSVVMCNYRVKTVVLETRTILLFESCRLCFRQFFLITCFTQIKLNLPYLYVRSQKKIAGTVIRITYRESRLKGAISAHRLSFERPLSDGKTPAPELSNRPYRAFVKDGAMRR